MTEIGVSGPTLSKCLRKARCSWPVMNLSRTNCNLTAASTSTNAFRANVSSSMANAAGSSPGGHIIRSNWRLYFANLPGDV